MLKLRTPIFRVSFPQVFEARSMQPGQPAKYSLTMLFDLAEMKKDAAQWKKWQDMLAAVKLSAQEKWPKGVPANFKNPFRDGVEKEQYEGYGKGIIFVVASTKTRPGVVDQSVKRIIDPEQFYAGCYAHADINPFAWEKLGKHGVSFGLQNVQLVKAGEPLGGRSRAEDDFCALDSDLDPEKPEAATTEDDPTNMFA